MSMHSDGNETRTVTARYGDGRSAARQVAQVGPSAEGLQVLVAGKPDELWRYGDLRAAAPLGRDATSALLASTRHDDATLLIEDRGLIGEILARAPHLTTRQTRWRALLPGLAFGAAAGLLVAAIYVLELQPAKAVARMIPHTVRAQIGDGAVGSMIGNRQICVEPAGRAALARLVKRVDPGWQDTIGRVTVVDMALVNAFAVPGGRVVLTRAIIERAASADEVAGVLAHEFGHTEQLHPETGLVRSIGLWALLSFMFTGQPSALGNIGGLLAQLSYTRSAEREADAIALAKLKAAGIATSPLAGFFRRMAAQESSGAGSTERVFRGGELLSTHPATADRIAVIEAVAPYPATPALTESEWRDLRGICTTRQPAETVPRR